MSKRKEFTILQYLSPCNCFRRKWRWCLSRNLAFLISIHWRIIDRLNQSEIYFQVEFSDRHISNHIPLFRILFIDILLLSQISFKCFFYAWFPFSVIALAEAKDCFSRFELRNLCCKCDILKSWLYCAEFRVGCFFFPTT